MKAAASFFLLNFKPEKFSTSCQTFAAAGGVDQTYAMIHTQRTLKNCMCRRHCFLVGNYKRSN